MKKFLIKVVLLLILIVSIIGGYLGFTGYTLYKKAITETSINQKINEIKRENENYIEYDKLPKDYVNAVIAIEDRRFYQHNGVNIISIGRAVVKNIKEKKLVEGGSTITQQLAKNVYFTQKKEFTRKIAEVFMAFEFEKNCTKEEIFELYVNTIYFGDGYYCIYDAAEGYFDKKVEEMDLYECTLLAGIPNAPSVYAPTKNPELARERQEKVIESMVKYNFLKSEEADKILIDRKYVEPEKNIKNETSENEVENKK